MQIYLPIADVSVNWLLLLAMGGGVGFISGLFGVGGGFVMTPLLIFIGIPTAIAVATQAAQIAASSMTGSIGYWRRRAVDVKLGLVLAAGGLIGTVLGVWFFNVMRRLGQLDVIIAIAYVVLFGVIGGLMLFESLRAMWLTRKGIRRPPRRPGEHPWYLGLPLKMRFHQSKLYGSIIPLALLALLIAFIGAVLGIGGGFIAVPALIYLFRIPAAVVVGTSLFQILLTMVAATIMHATSNHSVDLVLALLLIVGGVVGAQFGAIVGRNLRGDAFRLMLAILILGVGVRFAGDIILKPDETFSIVTLDN
ncbi:MAG: sulfite exporter TauE/SafE family protein [Chelatococcus sp.]|uniref:sulfite exporter TauE/SafE family protein n=1 Tax=unclassified Chelatococcus TaxID=2638111 RepID=UPI001BCBEBF2|nr:sulfite exporter TauE/SafE family protein [Chelatococcus sp.]MBS7740929.1 sulfite exporter TauE/SafE family protein [Chelatococcus sp. HY11]CAH1659321.1 putative membrane transporter protein [Hyphomicrobiales bacterium]MBX3537208.1 sulfite exporter TauE/SafE family protein [Chelatococcus sp.]MBX3546780.1 sulfite exporter TauE/SafE family protein [Chelatococcus sp.]MCO5077747.1 sulfite exporter TauE/SafE family protein [Chelatococcus sp.]